VRQQAFWLAESGLQRAAQALVKSSTYEGETWVVPENVLGTERAGVVVIRVEEVPEAPAVRRVRVEVAYPRDGIQRHLEQRDVMVR
jgi:hypothetical protein